MNILKQGQYNFIQDELWLLTFGAAFQRSGIYSATATNRQKNNFKKSTRNFISNELLEIYKTDKVDDLLHIENIHSISNYSTNFSEIFAKGRINFGIAQKMLNLYLKYMWSLGLIQEPPHFPVDRIIQIKLIGYAKEMGLPTIGLEAWTRFNDEKHYLKVINSAKELILKNEKYKNYSLAELELELFERR